MKPQTSFDSFRMIRNYCKQFESMLLWIYIRRNLLILIICCRVLILILKSKSENDIHVEFLYCRFWDFLKPKYEHFKTRNDFNVFFLFSLSNF